MRNTDPLCWPDARARIFQALVAPYTYPELACPTLEAFEEVLGNLLMVFATLELLHGKTLHEEERNFVESCRDKAHQGMAQFSRALSDNPTPLMAEIGQLLVDLNERFIAYQDSPSTENSAVEMARQIFPTTPREPSEFLNMVVGARVCLIEHDMGLTSEAA